MASCLEKSETTCRKYQCKSQGQPLSGLCVKCFGNTVTDFEKKFGFAPVGVALKDMTKSFVLLEEQQPPMKISDMVIRVVKQFFTFSCKKTVPARNKKKTGTRSKQARRKTCTRTNRAVRKTRTYTRISLQELEKWEAEFDQVVPDLENNIAGKRLQLQTLQSLLNDLTGVKVARFVEEEKNMDDLAIRVLDLRKCYDNLQDRITCWIKKAQSNEKGLNNEETPAVEKKKKRGKRGGKKIKKKTHASEGEREKETH